MPPFCCLVDGSRQSGRRRRRRQWKGRRLKPAGFFFCCCWILLFVFLFSFSFSFFFFYILVKCILFPADGWKGNFSQLDWMSCGHFLVARFRLGRIAFALVKLRNSKTSLLDRFFLYLLKIVSIAEYGVKSQCKIRISRKKNGQKCQ